MTLGGAPAGGSLYGALEVIGLPRNAATRKGVVTGYRLIGALRYNPATPTYALTGAAAKVSKGCDRAAGPQHRQHRGAGHRHRPRARPARHAPGLGQGDADPARQARVAAAGLDERA